jgi:soluble lytic murein transglycosylase-like protein
MTRRRLTALALALCAALPALFNADVARAETPPAEHLHSATIDLGAGWGQTVWLDEQERPFDLGLVFRLPAPKAVPGIAIPVVYEGDVPGMIRSAAARWGVDAGRMDRIAKCESRYDPRATSKGGHRGIFQFDGPTWRGRAGWAGVSTDFAVAYDARANVEVAAATMARGEWSRWECRG